MSTHPYRELARELKELPWVVDAVPGFAPDGEDGEVMRMAPPPTLTVRVSAAPFLGSPDIAGALAGAVGQVRESLRARFGDLALITFEL